MYQYVLKKHWKKGQSLLLILGILSVASIIIPLSAYGDVVSPKKQTNSGISPQNVFCKENLFKLILKSSDKPICVKPESAKKMMAKGITKSTDIQGVEKFEESIKNKNPMAKISKVISLKVDSGYHVVFEACAGKQEIRAPEVIVTSDSETRFVKLVEKLLPNTCETNSVQIKTGNPDSIKLDLVNKGGVTSKITQLEN